MASDGHTYERAKILEWMEVRLCVCGTEGDSRERDRIWRAIERERAFV